MPWKLGFYLDMQKVLRRAGCERPEWQPPLAFADALTAERPEAGARVQRLTRIYYAARFGGRLLESAEIAEARQLVGELARALRVRS